MDELKQVIAATLKVPAESITDDASPTTLPQWDSLAHLSLVMAIENHFAVKFTLEEIISLQDLPAIRRQLLQKK